MLQEGDTAPDFSAVDHNGNEFRMSDFNGKKVWLWFFSSPGGNNGLAIVTGTVTTFQTSRTKTSGYLGSMTGTRNRPGHG